MNEVTPYSIALDAARKAYAETESLRAAQAAAWDALPGEEFDYCRSGLSTRAGLTAWQESG